MHNAAKAVVALVAIAFALVALGRASRLAGPAARDFETTSSGLSFGLAAAAVLVSFVPA